MNHRILALSLFALCACSKTEPTGGTPPAPKPAVNEADKKGLLDKAKEAAGNIKENASTPLTEKSVTDVLGVAKDLKAELAKAGEGGAMDLKTMIAKAKDLKTVAEKHGLKTSELTGLVARVSMVMGALNSGNVPDNLKTEASLLTKHQTELQALFQK